MQKVNFFGNTNNTHYIIARYLKDLGVDVAVYDDNLGDKYYRAIDESFGFDPEILVTHPDFNIETAFKKKDDINRIFEKYRDDFNVASYFYPAIFNRLGINIEIFLAMGADTLTMPYKTWDFIFHGQHDKYSRLLVKSIKGNAGYVREFLAAPQNQFHGIRKAKSVVSHDLHYFREPNQFPNLEISGLIPMTYPNYTWESMREYVRVHNPEIVDFAMRLRKTYDTIFIFAGKHDFNYKGSINFLNQYKSIIKSNKFGKCLLVAFDVGSDRKIFRQICEDYLEEDSFVILPFLSRSKLMTLYSYADFSFGNWAEIDLKLNGIICAAHSLGIPLISYYPGADFGVADIPGSYRFVSIKNEIEDNTNLIASVRTNSSTYQNIQKSSNEWYVKETNNFINSLIGKIINK